MWTALPQGRYINPYGSPLCMEVMSSQNKASRDGLVAEALAGALFGNPVSSNALLDYLDVQGVAVEVKSCIRWIRTAHVSTGVRRGRFMLNGDQHQELLRLDGYYLFVLLDEAGFPAQAKCVPARDIQHPRLADVTARSVGIVWTTVFPAEED
jgi:hypothetical protein